jgi:hypothetical protein
MISNEVPPRLTLFITSSQTIEIDTLKQLLISDLNRV